MVCNASGPSPYERYRRWLYDNYESRGVVTSITFEDWMEISACDTEEEECHIEQLCEKAKKMEEPIVIDPDKSFDTEKKRQLKELNLAMAMIAIGSMELEDKEK